MTESFSTIYQRAFKEKAEQLRDQDDLDFANQIEAAGDIALKVGSNRITARAIADQLKIPEQVVVFSAIETVMKEIHHTLGIEAITPELR